MRHRIDISPQAKVMLKSIAERLGAPTIALSTVAEMCIQSAYDNAVVGDSFREELNPIQLKLDDIYNILQEVIPEI